MADEEKKGPESKTRAGRFQVSLWRTKRHMAARNNFEPEREIVSERACIQYSRLNHLTQSWERQQVWCNLDELRDLSQALDKIGRQEE